MHRTTASREYSFQLEETTAGTAGAIREDGANRTHLADYFKSIIFFTSWNVPLSIW
jgi:hypothetical protein